MPSLDMDGPYFLSEETIDEVVTLTSPGNYALGDEGKERAFRVSYIGRSDTDVNDRLKEWVSNTNSPLFKFSYATSPKAAFEKECLNYHEFGESEALDNEIHPRRPDGQNWICPLCDVFD